MNNLGILHFFLSIQFLQMDDGIFVSQPKYDLDLLKQFNLDNSKPCATPYHSGVNFSKYCDSPRVDTTLYRELVGSLIYLMHT